jgi:hypothetical protein
MSEMIYLSFAILTTLGYGDIRPNISVLRSLAILEGKAEDGNAFFPAIRLALRHNK